MVPNLGENLEWQLLFNFFCCFPLFIVCLSPEFLPVSGPLTWWCASTFGAALLCSSRVGSCFGACIHLGIWLIFNSRQWIAEVSINFSGLNMTQLGARPCPICLVKEIQDGTLIQGYLLGTHWPSFWRSYKIYEFIIWNISLEKVDILKLVFSYGNSFAFVNMEMKSLCQKLRLNFNRNGLPHVNKELGFRRRVQISILQTTWQPG